MFIWCDFSSDETIELKTSGWFAIYLAASAAGFFFGMSILYAMNRPMTAYVALAHCVKTIICN